MKKGFTLIELLAVIIILAIILTIAITSVSGIIENSKKEAFKSSLIIASKKIKSNSYISGISTGNLQSLELNPNNLEGNWEYIPGTSDVKFLAGTYDKKSELVLNYDLLLSQFNTSFNPVVMNLLNNTNSDTYASTLDNTVGVPLKNYKIYGNSTQVTTTQGKNLFDKSKISNGSISQITNGIRINNSYATSTGINISSILLPNTTYTISAIYSGLTENSSGAISLIDTTYGKATISMMIGWYTGFRSRTFTTPADMSGYKIYIYGDADAIVDFTNIQIELGSTATSYETFTPNSPSPDYPASITSVVNPVVTVNSANLIQNGDFANGVSYWSIDGATITAASNAMSTTGNSTKTFIAARQSTNIIRNSNRKIFLKAKVRTTSDGVTELRLGDVNNGEIAQVVSNPTKNTWYDMKGILKSSFNVNNYIFGVYMFSPDTNGKTMEIMEYMAVDMGIDSTNPLYNLSVSQLNSQFPNWSNNVIQTINFPYTLRGLPNGTRDFIDYQNSRIVRNVGERILTGTETWTESGKTNSTIYVAYTPFTNSALANLPYNDGSPSAYCTHGGFKEYDSGTMTSGFLYNVNSSHWLVLPKLLATNINEFKAYIALQYSQGTPIKVYYQLETPTYEPITLPPIPTSIGQTNITVSGGANISADYYQNK